MRVLSIHSHVASGHVGNSAAVFPLQRLGHDVIAVPTVILSHHPGHGAWHGHHMRVDDLAAVFDGLDAHGVYGQCDAVLSGYLGGSAAAGLARHAWSQVRNANPQALVCCDPIMGDTAEGLYVAEDLIRFYREDALAEADVIFPNRFELELLSGVAVTNAATALSAARSVMPSDGVLKMVLATSVPLAGELGVVLVSATEAWQIQAPEIELAAKGAGDFFAAVWLGHYLRDRDAVRALGAAGAATGIVVAAAAQQAARELPIVQCQGDWMSALAVGTPTPVDP